LKELSVLHTCLTTAEPLGSKERKRSKHHRLLFMDCTSAASAIITTVLNYGLLISLIRIKWFTGNGEYLGYTLSLK